MTNLRQQAGNPSLGEMETWGTHQDPAVKMGKSKLSSWFNGVSVPDEGRPFTMLIELLEARAQRKSGEQSRGIHWWRELRNAADRGKSTAAEESAEAPSIALSRQNVGREHLSEGAEQAERHAEPSALRDLPSPLHAWTAQRLGVHPAFSGHPSDEGSVFVLPTYVHRTHDSRLHRLLATAVDSARPLLILITGESCTGKTRTAYEAIHATIPREFDLLCPVDAHSLLSALSAGLVSSRTVLWLDEAWDYLAGDVGETAAAALLRRLDGDGPLVVIATLWPEQEEELTASARQQGRDTHRLARKLLSQAHHVYVPRSFTDGLEDACDAAAQDQALTAALDTGTCELTQVLAAGPELVKHYEHAVGEHGPYGKAVISAALDADRLNVTQPLPLGFLEAAASGYLTDAERAAAGPDWFAAALVYARIRIKQTIECLQYAPSPTGMGPLPGMVLVNDYLRQHGRRVRRTFFPAAPFWDATEHLTTPADLHALGESAYCRGRLRRAAQLFCAAADAGHTEGLLSLAELRRDISFGRDEEVQVLCQAAAEAGSAEALVRLATMQEGAENSTEAERLYQEAAVAGHGKALEALARIRGNAGDWETAERLARQAAAAGEVHALVSLAKARKDAGDQEESGRLYLAAIKSGAGYAVPELASLRGSWNQLEPLWQEAAAAGDSLSLSQLAQLKERQGEFDEAERLYRTAAATGYGFALANLARIREQAGDSRVAEQLACQAAEVSGSADVLWSLMLKRRKSGDSEKAEELLRIAVASGDSKPLRLLAEQCLGAGDRKRAERFACQALDGGNPFHDPIPELALLARVHGEDGLSYRRHGVEDDGTMAMPWQWPKPRTTP
ncbi:sel1 repeat family protein [Streptomyces sp. NBC_01210]|uniref:tetratricopeptide repeat protein n=1 Tax=Streptomyces sp. NBC_01210 TaxID=2903774 RepID=UPI002E162951|nr:sel1 repeat family protein [Streptomyces sp. NBC_01210]